MAGGGPTHEGAPGVDGVPGWEDGQPLQPGQPGDDWSWRCDGAPGTWAHRRGPARRDHACLNVFPAKQSKLKS